MFAVYGKRVFMLLIIGLPLFFLLSLFSAARGLRCFVQIARGGCSFVVASLNAEPGL